MTNNILRFWRSLQSDDPFEPLFSAAPILIHSIDSKGVLMRVSRFWADKLGYQEEEMIGRKSVEFLTEESRDYASNVVLPQFFKDGSVENVAYDFVRKDGRLVPVLMSAIAEFDAEGQFVRSLAIMFDNTEAKRASAELRQQHRRDAIGDLVVGVAHDFNNLLAIIQGNLDFLKRDPDAPMRDEYIDSALNATRRGASVTRQLLSYGRKSNLSPSLVDLNDTVTSADRMVRRLFPSNIRLETVTGGGLWKVFVDASLLESAVLNILNNSRAAIDGTGRITMETRNVRIDDNYIADRDEDIAPGRYVMLAISDTGTGMEPDVVAQIFEPFFTTKEVGAGSGLGLSMVDGFMRQSNGTIRAYSEPGVGTTLRLYFPVAAPEQDIATTPSAPTPQIQSDTAICLVEDEDEVRKVIATQLRDEGLEVVEFASGDAAWRSLRDGARPHILITDIVMPGSLQGPELVQNVRSRFPDLPVLFISGYPTEAAIHGNGLQPDDMHLIKPVQRSDLLRAVSQLLDSV